MDGALGRALRRSPYDREITRLALPALGALAADPLVSLIDTAFVGRLGTTELGALAVAAAVFGVAFAVFNFLSYATTPLVAVRLGAGDGAGAGRIAAAAGSSAMVLGVAATALLVVAARPLVMALGAGPELVADSVEYLRIRAFALPAVLLITAGHGVFRGAQDTRTPFLVAIWLNAVNLVLDPLLIFGAGMGVAGAAWATLVAQWLGAAGFALAFRRRRRVMGLHLARPEWVDVRSLATAARSLIARTAALLVMFTATTAVAARLGAVQVAAHQIALQLFFFLSLALDAVAIAAQAMLGLAKGTRDQLEIRHRADRLVGLGTLAGVAIGAVLLLVSPWLPTWFTTDPEVISAFHSVVPPLVLVQVLGGAVFAWDGIVMGVTDFRYAMLATVVPAVVALAALAPVLPWGWPLSAVWWAMVVLMVGRAALLAGWHRYRLVGGPALH